MAKRRLKIIAASVAVLALFSIIVLQTGMFAQDPMGPPPGMDMGPGMDMMGPEMGMPGAGPTNGLQWTRNDPPEELTMTYDEFIARSGEPRAALPDAYLRDPEGAPIKNTLNMWRQLQRIYSGRRVGPDVDVALERPGAVGGPAVREIDRFAGYLNSLANAMVEAYEAGLNSFTFEIGQPRNIPGEVDVAAGQQTRGTFVVPVIMRVRSGAANSYPEVVARKLKKFDCRGFAIEAGNQIQSTSAPFAVHTLKGGVYNPVVINLVPGAVQAWDTAWRSNQVRCTLYDRSGQEIASTTVSAGHGGDILAKMINPDRIYWNTRYRLNIAPDGQKWGGGKWDISGARGWIYEFSFNLDREQMQRVHRARCAYEGNTEIINQVRSALQGAVGRLNVTPSQVGVDMMGPGPGMEMGPPGMPGMPPPPGMDVPAGPMVPPPVM